MSNAADKTDPGSDLGSDLVWGTTGIGRVIGQNSRQTAHMLENGMLPAKKVGGRWVAARSALRAFFLNVPAPREAA